MKRPEALAGVSGGAEMLFTWIILLLFAVCAGLTGDTRVKGMVDWDFVGRPRFFGDPDRAPASDLVFGAGEIFDGPDIGMRSSMSTKLF